MPLAVVLAEANRIKAELIDRHPDLFDERLEVYPNPDRPFRLPIFPGRCPILDVPLEGVPPRQQLARLVRWIENPGKPMAKDALLAWVRARLPGRSAKREGGGQLQIADTKVQPRVTPGLPVPPPAREGGCQLLIADTAATCHPHPSEDDFLDGLDYDPSPGYLPGEDYFAEKARAELAGHLERWERLRSFEGARVAMAFLDGLGVPTADKVKEQLGRAMVAGYLLNERRKKGTPRRDIPSEWEAAYRESGWDASVRFLDSVKVGLGHQRPALNAEVQPTIAPALIPAAPSTRPPAATAYPASRTKVDYRGRFMEIQHAFWGLKQQPPNGSLNAVLGPHLRLCLAFGKTPEEIDAFYRRELLDRPELSFSRRLSEDPEKVFRSEYATAKKIEADNGYQPDPEASSAIFQRLATAFRRRGLDPLDPTAFGRYRRSGEIDRTPREVELNDEARDKVVKHAGWLCKDAEVVLKAARLVAGFVEANPGRQLAAVLVPDLCGELPVMWLCDSDRKARRCKKAERFLKSLVDAGVLEVARPPLFLGPRNPDNRATEYALGEAVRASDREGGGQLYIADTAAAACPPPWHDFLVREVRRLRRQNVVRHGPPERRRVA